MAADLELMANLMLAGNLKPAIERRYPLQRAGDALDFIGAGHARGKVLVTVFAPDHR
jgi:NADPH:quinone reductase-like Zn-dependent oxidoreductase